MKIKKIKIMYDEKKISDEEIIGYKDFDSLIQIKEKVVRQNIINQTIILGILLIGAFSLVYFVSMESDQEPKQQVIKENNVAMNGGNKDPETQLNPQHSSSKSEEINNQRENIDLNPSSGNKPTVKKPRIEEKQESLIQEDHVNKFKKDDFIDAHPKDGFPAFYDYLENSMLYPQKALEDEIEGTVLVQFTILKTGEVENIKIVKGLSPEVDQESIRLLSEMPEWVPASIGKEKISTKHTIPLKFQIAKNIIY